MISGKPVFKLNQPDDSYKFQALPCAPGQYPYHLDYPGNPDHLVFHVVGDTGGFRDTQFQHIVAAEMAAQYETEENANERPEFLYHLGDVVYNYGEAASYAQQFFKPYENYTGRIYAIAGNHDSDVNPDAAIPYQSLDAFIATFCDNKPHQIAFGEETQRKSNVQPNVYWTLKAPLATIIGMHSNVPKYGAVTSEQRQWLVEELKAAKADKTKKALIIAIHHAPYSTDTNHSSSLPMIELLEGVFEETGVLPDLVVSGHVHNYQRFTREVAGRQIPFVVAGAGGYNELHSLATPEDTRFTSDSPLFDDVSLKAYNDKHHGFLKLSIQRQSEVLILRGKYFLVDSLSKSPAQIADSFEIRIN